MTKKLLVIFASLLICFACAFSASSVNDDRTFSLVVDKAGIFTDDEEVSLTVKCEAFTAEYEMEIAILTVSDLEGKSAEAYADDFYDYNGYGFGDNDDGMLVLFVPGREGERELHITTHGKGNDVFDASVRENIFSAMKELIIAEDYAGAFNTYVDLAERATKPHVSVKTLLAFCVVGMIAGLLITGSMISKNKSVLSQNDARVYKREGSMVLTNSMDNFLYTRTKVTPKADSGSSSSTHTSSSGRTHGGTGGKF